MMSSALFCNNCGAPHQSGARFCRSCGHSLQAEPTTIYNPATGQLLANSLLKQRYRIIELIGEGGFGAVYLAEDTKFGNRQVALKEMGQRNLNPQEQREAADAFKREAIMLGHLQHPNLPSIFDHFEENSRCYLVMSFIQGQTIEDYLSSKQAGKLPLDEVLDIGTQLCTVLDYLHHRQPPIIFRDLKPANIMRTSDGHIYLIDFGIARHFKPGQTKDTVNLGSPGYAPPEQYKAQTTPRSDIYSMGVVLHQLLSGYDPSSDPSPHPFRRPPLQSLVPAVPAGLATLITQMLEMDENNRPANVLLVKQALQTSRPLPFPPPLSQGQTSIPVPPPQGPSPVPVPPPQGQARSQTKLYPPNPYTRTVPDPQGTLLTRYTGHTQSVHSIAWSPDGTHIASASKDKTMHVWPVNSHMRPFADRGHFQPVHSIAWSPDGTRIASASGDKTVRVWNAAGNGQPAIVHRAHSDEVTSVAWSPDGTRIASASEDKTVQVWNVDNSGQSSTYYGHTQSTQSVRSIAWSPDGTRIASVSEREVHIWHANTGGQLFIHKGHTKPVYSIAWSRDGTRIASTSGDKTVQVWNAAGSGQPAIVYKAQSDEVTSVAWSPDGTRIVFTADGTVQVWNAAGSGPPSILYRGPSYVQGFIHKRRSYSSIRLVAWSPIGGHIAFVSEGNTVQVWNTTGHRQPYTYKDHVGIVGSMAWSPDGTRIASASDNKVHVWYIDGSRAPFILDSHADTYVVAVAWSPDGKRIASVSDCAVQVWNADGSERPFVYSDPSYAPGLVAWSSDRIHLAFASGNTVQVAGNGRLYTYQGHVGTVGSIVWSPDGTRIASASEREVHIWHADGRVKPSIYNGHTKQVLSIAWSPDGTRVATTSEEKVVRVWNVDGSGQPVIYRGHTNQVLFVAWSPDGTRIASASEDKTVRVWNADGRGKAFIYKGHFDVVRSVAWSPSGTHLISVSQALEDAVHVWNADDQGSPFIYKGHNYYDWAVHVTAVAWSPDGTHIASSTSGNPGEPPNHGNKAVHVWNADGSGPPFIYKGHSDGVLSVVWSPNGKCIASSSRSGSVHVWIAR